MNPFSPLRVSPYPIYHPLSPSAIKAAVLGQTNTAPHEVYLALTENIAPSIVENIIVESILTSYSKLDKYRIPNPYAPIKEVRQLTLWEFFKRAYSIYVEVDRMVLAKRFSGLFDYDVEFPDRRALMAALCELWELNSPTAYQFYTALHINNATVREWLTGKEYTKESTVEVVLKQAGINVEAIQFGEII